MMEFLSAYWPYLIFGGLMILMMRGGGCCGGGHQHGTSHGQKQGEKQEGTGVGGPENQLAEGQAHDPICGMIINIKDTAVYKFYDGKEYYFCSEDCARIFDSRRNVRAG